MESDSQLVARAQSGDQQAFAELVSRYSALVFRPAVSILGREFIPDVYKRQQMDSVAMLQLSPTDIGNLIRVLEPPAQPQQPSMSADLLGGAVSAAR